MPFDNDFIIIFKLPNQNIYNNDLVLKINQTVYCNQVI